MTASLLPPNASDLERAVEVLQAARVGAIDTPLRKLWSVDDCPSELLPWLAWALSIDQWDPNWSDAIRRARIRVAIDVARAKGTIHSVRSVIASFGGAVAMREWWETDPPGPPHTFELSVAITGGGAASPSAAFIDQVIAEVIRTKPVRSHFTFTVATVALARVGMIGAARPAVLARLNLASPALATSFELLCGDQAGGALLLSGDQGGAGAKVKLNLYS